jgi:hypothetical protein
MKSFKAYLLEDNKAKDTIEMSVPLFIRVLEWAREEAKTDVEVHELVERILAKNKCLATEDYNSIVK